MNNNSSWSMRQIWHLSIFLLVIFSTYSTASTQQTTEYRWKNIPIGGGGYITGIEFHPHQKGLIYARTDVGGSYRRDADNSSWIPLNDATPVQYLDDMGILSLALNSQDTNQVYLLSGLYTQPWAPTGALLVSANKGKTWSRHALPFKVGGNEDGRGTGERLAINPKDPTHLFIGTQTEGLWESHDSGQHWQPIARLPASSINALAFHTPSSVDQPLSLFVATNDPERPLFVSEDQGKSWRSLITGFKNLVVHRAASTATSMFFSASDHEGPNGINTGGVWRYNLADESWTDVTPAKGQGGFSGLAVDPRHDNRLLAATTNRWYPQDEIYLSEDDGAHWRPLLQNAVLDEGNSPYVRASKPHWITDIKIDPFDSQHAIFVTGYGLYETHNLSDQNTVKWRFQNDGIEETVILELISPRHGPNLLSVMGDIDGFRHWTGLKKSPKSERFHPARGSNNGIAVAAQNESIMARTIERGEGVHAEYSEDAGANWKAFPSEPMGAKAGQIALSAQALTLVWTPDKMGSYYSTNQGQTWNASQGLPNNLKPIADSQNDNIFYAYDELNGTLYRSVDGAKQFNAIADQLPKLPEWQRHRGTLRAVPQKVGHLFITTGGALYHSTRFGMQPKPIKAVTESYAIGFGKAKKQGGYPTLFLWGKVDGKVGYFRSEDEGEHWVQINDSQHQFSHLRCITGDMQEYGVVYLGTSGRGIIMGTPK